MTVRQYGDRELTSYGRCQLCGKVLPYTDAEEHIRMHGVAALEDGQECGDD